MFALLSFFSWKQQDYDQPKDQNEFLAKLHPTLGKLRSLDGSLPTGTTTLVRMTTAALASY